MSPETLVLCVSLGCAWAALVGVQWLIADREAWAAKAQHWFEQANEHEADADYYRSLLEWLNKHGKEPVKAPRYAYPMELPIGTMAHPIVTPTGDTARASTVDDLLDDCGYRE